MRVLRRPKERRSFRSHGALSISLSGARDLQILLWLDINPTVLRESGVTRRKIMPARPVSDACSRPGGEPNRLHACIQRFWSAVRKETAASSSHKPGLSLHFQLRGTCCRGLFDHASFSQLFIGSTYTSVFWPFLLSRILFPCQSQRRRKISVEIKPVPVAVPLFGMPSSNSLHFG